MDQENDFSIFQSEAYHRCYFNREVVSEEISVGIDGVTVRGVAICWDAYDLSVEMIAPYENISSPAGHTPYYARPGPNSVKITKSMKLTQRAIERCQDELKELYLNWRCFLNHKDELYALLDRELEKLTLENLDAKEKKLAERISEFLKKQEDSAFINAFFPFEIVSEFLKDRPCFFWPF